MVQRIVHQVCEPPHSVQVGSVRNGQCQHARVLDQKQIVLPNPEAEQLPIQRAIPDFAHERVPVLGVPDRIGGGA
jgi:hypothetical protein